jgi:phage N-6-adenine-methyltransferase
MSLVGFKAKNHPQQPVSDEVDDRGTDPAFFATLNQRFRFTVDVAAAPHNAKCERYYTRLEDGLAQSWAGERVWCNPPYSAALLRAFVEKAWDAMRWAPSRPTAELVVMLVPANRCEQPWWQELVEPYRDKGEGFSVEFLRGRLRFIKPGSSSIEPNERPPFGCALLIWEKP